MSDATTWVGVAASAVSGIVTVATVYLRSRTKVQLAAIDKGTPDAARVVADAVSSFGIDTTGLTKAQLYQLARDEIANRDRRHARVLWGSLSFSVVLAATAVALARGSGDSYEHSTHVDTNDGTMVIDQHGSPAPAPSQ